MSASCLAITVKHLSHKVQNGPFCPVVCPLQELEAIKARVREMEEEAEKLKELQNEVEKQMNLSPPPGVFGCPGFIPKPSPLHVSQFSLSTYSMKDECHHTLKTRSSAFVPS